MPRTLRLLVLLVLALALVGSADAACKVKADDATGNDADNKIQDAPAKRVTNKISFDVVDDRKKRLANKVAFDVPQTNVTYTDEDDNDN